MLSPARILPDSCIVKMNSIDPVNCKFLSLNHNCRRKLIRLLQECRPRSHCMLQIDSIDKHYYKFLFWYQVSHILLILKSLDCIRLGSCKFHMPPIGHLIDMFFVAHRSFRRLYFQLCQENKQQFLDMRLAHSIDTCCCTF